MITDKLRSYLDLHDVKYVTIRHSPAFTAQEVAQTAHVPAKEMAKTVIVNVEGRMAMVVIPASKRLSLDEVRFIVGNSHVRLAQEHEFRDIFPDCETGAMPPFGNLYRLEVYVDPALAENEQIAFNAGSHSDVLRLRWTDYERLVEPRVVAMTII